MAELRENEARTLLTLSQMKGSANVDELIRSANLDESAVTRAILSLSGQAFLILDEKLVHMLRLSDERRNYAELGLPEMRVTNLAFET